jgi:hypothetical protein
MNQNGSGKPISGMFLQFHACVSRSSNMCVIHADFPVVSLAWIFGFLQIVTDKLQLHQAGSERRAIGLLKSIGQLQHTPFPELWAKDLEAYWKPCSGLPAGN